ncbi:YrbL family protein [Palleronia abyssalis]|uniref:PhoP regulatory network protein YrbL n=1 Tax=Palleronia abyssalis TaxID=1501240 RepID=A0A2R8BZ77_9RHOB|nr:YrbL family protein [Palleronia abyssalis]SPJ25475.1 hypothetical protein PAA8504_03326 [Palleronia abyssalis]
MMPAVTQSPVTESSLADAAWFIRLSGLEPVAGGAESHIFVRPGKPSQLIKVHHDRHIEALASSRAIKNRIRRWRGIGPHKTFLRQNRAYLEATLRAAELDRAPPLAHLRGVLLTDLGLGVVVQKIRDRSGEMAPTLFQLARDGRIDDEIIAALTLFARELSTFRIIGNDLNAGNLVYETRHARARIVLIEGYGSRNLIPLRRWSKRINDRSLSRRLEKLANSVGLTWNARDWSFSA